MQHTPAPGGGSCPLSGATVSQVRDPGFREVKQLARGHTAVTLETFLIPQWTLSHIFLAYTPLLALEVWFGTDRDP